MSTATETRPTALTTAAVDQACATLTVAFSGDPINRWILPDPRSYLATFPRVLRGVVDGARDAGTVDLLAGGRVAAIWHPPGRDGDEDAVVDALVAAVEPKRLDGVLELLEALASHHPQAPVWYLPFIGADPALQGRGHGSALLRKGLDRCDRDRLPAYLEASTPRNRALYARHGFEVVDEVRVADAPPLWPMVRPAS